MMHQGGMTAVAGTTRYILDDVNHDDFAAPGEIPEAPLTGFVYARGNRGWHRALPLDGGQMTGFLLTVGGSPGVPGLMIGSNDTGFYRSGASLWLNVGGAANVIGFLTTLVAMAVPLNMGNRQINAVADPALAQDALNLRTGDARYAPGAWETIMPEQGWSNSTLRCRQWGPMVQIDGTAQGNLAANASALLGRLPPWASPARPQYTIGLAQSGLNTGTAMLALAPGGVLQVQPHVAMDAVAVNMIVALD
jgi:hypothetical protein